MPTTITGLDAAIDAIARSWEEDRQARQERRHLDPADFAALRDAGLLRLAVPEDQGGMWRSLPHSVRQVCAPYRRLARADPSVALVSTMHPAVVGFWLITADPDQSAWEEQRRSVFASAADGEQWGTITSEPGSGGDISKTRAVATPTDAEPFLTGSAYAVSGDKHFGSGSGITDRMMTTAIPDGENEPAIFVLDFRERPWDGTDGLEVVAEWDGMGMAATQSHAMRLDHAPAVRQAWTGSMEPLQAAAAPLVLSLFTAVTLGILDEAISTARSRVAPRAELLRPYEQVEWARAERDHWLAVQAFEGSLAAVESGDPATARHAVLRAKSAVAEIAEDTLLRLGRVLGGGTFSRRSPFAHWFEDVRALGFLRPPWGLSSDMVFETSLE